MDFHSLPPWGPINELAPRMLMIALIKLRDTSNTCDRSQECLAQFVGRSTEVIRQSALKLQEWGLLLCERNGRPADGTFGGKIYRLPDTDAVRELISYFDPPQEPSPDSLVSSRRDPPKGLRENAQSRRGKPCSPPQEIIAPPGKAWDGPYKDSRARAGASQSFILHSLPVDFQIEDADLAEQVAEALNACGEGTRGVETARLAESLAFHIPRALQTGFSFEKDILPCIRHYTRYVRPKPLNRFDVTFREDLPEWRAVRLARLRDRQRAAENGERSRSPKAAETKPERGTSDGVQAQSNDDAKRSQRIVRLRRVIDVFERGDEASMISLKFELPGKDRDLFGAELSAALTPMIAQYRTELATLIEGMTIAG